MKRTAALLLLFGGHACTFPDFRLGGTSDAGLGCRDGVRNGLETGEDCGIEACGKPCPVGQGCDSGSDCGGGACEAGVCQAESCRDALENGSESDVDCGGSDGCRRCRSGERCHSLADCDGGRCVSGQCQEPSCEDELHNGSETDLDCGGECAACVEGRACRVNADCDNVACVGEKCQPRDCADGIKNQNETDLDCGGSCPSPCQDGQRCQDASDCVSGVCPPQTLRCAEATCDDEVRNGGEPAVDCGASCAKKCALLVACGRAEDCDVDATCSEERCVPSAPTGEALSTLGWVATASHAIENAPPEQAVDGSLSTGWITGADQRADMWLAVDMQSPQAFFSIELLIAQAADAEDAAEMVDVWLSIDGSFTSRVKRSVPGEQKLVIRFDQAQVARQIKVSLSPGVSKARWWRVDELRVRQ